MVRVQLNQQQARHFAQAIFADIEKYISEHQEEYEAFLQAEMKSTRTGGKRNETKEHGNQNLSKTQ